MARLTLSFAWWSPCIRLLQVMAVVAFCLLYWTCFWAIIGLVLASLLAGILLLPFLFWPTAFQPWMPWYVNELPIWIVGGGLAAGGVLGFVQNLRIVLGEVRRTLFFAEVKELAEHIVEETAEELGALAHGFSAPPNSRTIDSIQPAETGLVERHA
jgi:hypothetical protein